MNISNTSAAHIAAELYMRGGFHIHKIKEAIPEKLECGMVDLTGDVWVAVAPEGAMIVCISDYTGKFKTFPARTDLNVVISDINIALAE